MPQPAIVLDRVSLRYRISAEPVRSLKEFVIRRIRRNLLMRDHWALRDVSLEVHAGEVVGIIGRNGVGKTTLLKVVARVLRPTQGRVIVRGVVAPLLGLGAGFHDELTGRENVSLSWATLGRPVAEAAARFEAIKEFSGLGEFIEAPLRTYSSGMRARLGFAVATDVEPDILLLDEILSVGDAEFRKKSNERIQSFQQTGATVLLVSHGMSTIRQLCNRAILLDVGRIVAEGDPEEVITAYERLGELPAPDRAAASPAGT